MLGCSIPDLEITTAQLPALDEFCISGRLSTVQDHSLHTTLRTLLYPRVVSEAGRYFKPLTVQVNDKRAIRQHYDMETGLAKLGALRPLAPFSLPDHLIINDMSDSPDSLALIEGKLPGILARDNCQSVRLSGVEQYLSKLSRGKKFIVLQDSASRSSFLFCGVMTYGVWHAVQSVLPALLPWFFSGDNAVTPEEKEMLSSLCDTTVRRYVLSVTKLCARFDFRKDVLTVQFKGFNTAADAKRLDDIRSRIVRLDERIAELESQVSVSFREREQDVETAAMLDDKIANDRGGDDELIDFLSSSKSIRVLAVQGGAVDFEVSTTLANYDTDMYDTFVSSRSSILYRLKYHVLSTEDGVLLMNAIFRDQKVCVKMKARFVLNFDTGVWAISRDYTQMTADRVRNPHLTYYRCLGNNEAVLSRQLRERDVIGAFMTCVSVASNLNLAEHQNIQNIFNDILAHPGTPIQLPDGTCVSAVDAVKWLRENDAAGKPDGDTVKENEHEQANQTE